jgi:hypothetical protein
MKFSRKYPRFFTRVILQKINAEQEVFQRLNPKWYVRNFFAAAAVKGCQMVHFQTKNPNLGKFWRILDYTFSTYLKYIMAI